MDREVPHEGPIDIGSTELKNQGLGAGLEGVHWQQPNGGGGKAICVRIWTFWIPI